MSIVILNLLFGMMLLVAGRNLFWLCVGIIGFLVGVQCAASLGVAQEGLGVILAMALGLLGVVLAICFEWGTIVFGIGFVGGGYLLTNIFSLYMGHGYAWPMAIIGGILGMCLMILTFDLTLILISSLIGATLIVSAYHGTDGLKGFLFITCLVTGALVQYVALKGMENHGRTALGEQK